MAFRLTQTPTFKARVDVPTPNIKGGFDNSHFTCEYRRVETQELIDLRKELPADLLQKVVVGYEELIGPDGGPVEFNESNMQSLLAIPHAVIAMRDTFWSAMNKAKEKN